MKIRARSEMALPLCLPKHGIQISSIGDKYRVEVEQKKAASKKAAFSHSFFDLCREVRLVFPKNYG
jgi:hypothetical protein